MNKDEFLIQLTQKLSNIPPSEIIKIIDYYRETIEDKIEDGMSEELAIKSLGTFEEIIQNIEDELNLSIIVKEKVKNKMSDNSKQKNLLIIIAIIVTLPLWGAIAIAGIICILALYFAIWSIFISGVVAYFCTILTSFSAFYLGIIKLFQLQTLNGVCYIGIGLFIVGIVIALYQPTLWLIKKWLYLNVAPFKKIKQFIIRKG